MNDHHTHDQSVADTTPPAGGVFGDPNGGLPRDAVVSRTIDEILAMAKTPERRAWICLRADLQAQHDEIIRDLRQLVDAEGRVIVDDDAAIGDSTPAQRAAELDERARQLRAEMADSMWGPLLRGLTTDELALFNAEHAPKKAREGDEVDMTEYNTQLIAACSVASDAGPALTVDDVRKIRKTLGSRAVAELVTVANWVCTRGGVGGDIPKSSPFSPSRPGR